MNKRTAMTTIESTTIRPVPGPEYLPDEAELAAAAFFARYSGRTLGGRLSNVVC